MAYEVRVVCDKCGCGYSYKDFSLGKTLAAKWAREKGWQIGKRGWFCPDCKRKKGR